MLKQIQCIKKISIVTLILSFINLFSGIAIIVTYVLTLTKIVKDTIEMNKDLLKNIDIEHNIIRNQFEPWIPLIILFVISSIIGIAFLTLKIIILVKLNRIKSKYPEELETPAVLTLVGMFVPIVGIIGLIILLKKIKIVETKLDNEANDSSIQELK